MLDYQRTHRYFAQIADGMEPLGRDELLELGARDARTMYRGVHFEADSATLYRVNYAARLLSRVLAPLASFPCHTPDQLYERASAIDWSVLLTVRTRFAVFANVSDSRIRHSQYAARRLKDAIVDQFRSRVGRRPSVDTESPELVLHVFIHRDRATMSLDTSGQALHRRGYRTESGEAPMRETLAAAVIRLTEWDGERPLCDPMCGSGTLLCEALMRCCRIPGGYLRARFGFERLPDFDGAVWKAVKAEADGGIRPLPDGLIRGSDASRDAVAMARANLRRLPFGDRVRLDVSPFEQLGGAADSVIVCNPPWGIRTGAKNEVEALTMRFGDFLKQRCPRATAFIYFGDRALVKHVGLRTTWKKPLKSGALDGRLVRIDVYP